MIALIGLQAGPLSPLLLAQNPQSQTVVPGAVPAGNVTLTCPAEVAPWKLHPSVPGGGVGPTWENSDSVDAKGALAWADVVLLALSSTVVPQRPVIVRTGDSLGGGIGTACPRSVMPSSS